MVSEKQANRYGSGLLKQVDVFLPRLLVRVGSGKCHNVAVPGSGLVMECESCFISFPFCKPWLHILSGMRSPQ